MRATIEQLDEFHEQGKGKTPRITRENFQEYLRNPDRQALQFPSAEIAAKHGYTVEADVKPSTFEVKNLEPVSFLEESDGGSVVGKVLRGRALILEANFGLVDGQYTLDHQKEIPEEMRSFYIVLSGTLLRRSGGGLFVACLDWAVDRWVLVFLWVGGAFGGAARLVRSK